MDQSETARLALAAPGQPHYRLQDLFEPDETDRASTLSCGFFTRSRRLDADRAECLVDTFPDAPGAACCFVRLPSGDARTVCFSLQGDYRVEACRTGGWLVLPVAGHAPGYWIPRPPILRRQDAQGHIIGEQQVSLTGLDVSADALGVSLDVPAGWHLDWVFWRFAADLAGHIATLQSPLPLARQRFFLWGSKANVALPAGVYLYLVHGQVYTDAFVWPRRWKFHSELDAHGLYVALDGLEAATGETLYRLLKRQLLYSVIGQQADDGGWHQGEWTDLMESHYRLHNAAMLMLEAALEETGDPLVRDALERAAAFISRCTDRTDIGAWFLHDSLENSVEAMEAMREQTRTPWIPTRTLGKSPTNKLILNTHLDAIVTLDRYRRLTGDQSYDELLDSARAAARAILALRPAEPLYRLIYWAIYLTLLPKAEAMRLPLPLKVVKRLTWQHLWSQMHRIKRRFPRLVMPGGLIERHVAPLHYDINYHPVNLLDLVRYARRFPAEAHRDIIEQAVQVVRSRNLLQYWSEQEYRRFALVVWADALYQLCTLDPAHEYRQALAEAILRIEAAGLGLPPALLGGDAEVVAIRDRMPCPSPEDARLRVANLGRTGQAEFIVVNPSEAPIRLTWARTSAPALVWTDAEGHRVTAGAEPPTIPARGWMLGREASA